MKAFGPLDGKHWQFVNQTGSKSEPGKFLLVNPDLTVVSVQPDGSISSRPAGTDGPYEVCNITGTVVVFSGTGTPFPFGLANA